MKYQYKNTDITGLGKIPIHWGLDRLKDVCLVNTKALSSKTESNFEFSYLDISNVNSLGVISHDEISKTNFELAPSRARRITGKYDTIISSVRTNLQAVAFLDFDIDLLICSTGFFVCRPKFTSKVKSKFLYYLLLTPYSKDYFFSYSVGVSYPAIDENKFGTINLTIPTLNEQHHIVDYLDKVCVRIDEVIKVKEKQLLSLADFFTTKLSDYTTKGVSESETKRTDCLWLPEIKKDWKIKPLKRLLESKLKYGANEPADFEDEFDPRYIRITDFGKNGKLKKNTFKSLPKEKAENYMLKEGDVLFARSGATVGKTFIFKDYKGDACFAGYLIKAECNQSLLLPEYLYYFTKSKGYEEWKNLIFTQATIQNIGADKYQYLLLPVPPTIKEQKEIVDAIDLLYKKISSMEDKIREQIKTLQAYKKSLIHECVTGKKQVFDGIIKS